MGLLGDLLGTAIDVVTIPLDAIADVGNVVEGKGMPNIKNKVKTLGQDVAECANDVAEVDLI